MTLKKLINKGLVSEECLNHWTKRRNTTIKELLNDERRSNALIRLEKLLLLSSPITLGLAYIIWPSPNTMIGGTVLLAIVLVVLTFKILKINTGRQAEIDFDVQFLRRNLNLGPRQELNKETMTTCAVPRLLGMALNVLIREQIMDDSTKSYENRAIAAQERTSVKQKFDTLHSFLLSFGFGEPDDKSQYYSEVRKQLAS